jgi:hypothetical protein
VCSGTAAWTSCGGSAAPTRCWTSCCATTASGTSWWVPLPRRWRPCHAAPCTALPTALAAALAASARHCPIAPPPPGEPGRRADARHGAGPQLDPGQAHVQDGRRHGRLPGLRDRRQPAQPVQSLWLGRPGPLGGAAGCWGAAGGAAGGARRCSLLACCTSALEGRVACRARAGRVPMAARACAAEPRPAVPPALWRRTWR